MLNHGSPLLTKVYCVHVLVACDQNENGQWRCTGCPVVDVRCGVIKTQMAKNNTNTHIKILLSFVCCPRLLLFWPSRLLKEKVTAIYY